MVRASRRGLPRRPLVFVLFFFLAVVLLPPTTIATEDENDNDQVPMGTFTITNINFPPGADTVGHVVISPPLHFAIQLDEPPIVFSTVMDTDAGLSLQDDKVLWNSPENWGGLGGWWNLVTLEFDVTGLLDLWTVTCNLEPTIESLMSSSGPTEKYTTIPVIGGDATLVGTLLNLVGLSFSWQQESKFDVSLTGGHTALLNQNAVLESLTLDSATTLEFDGGRTLTIQNEFTNDGTLLMAEGSLLDSPFTIHNTNTIGGAGTIDQFLLNETNSTVSAQGGTLRLVSGSSNNGVLQADGGTLVLDGDVTNTGCIEATGAGEVHINAAVTSTGPGVRLRADGGSIILNHHYSNYTSIPVVNGGYLDITSGMDCTGSIDISGEGSIAVVRNTGDLNNGGTITVSGAGSVLRTDPDTPMGSSWIERTSRIIGSGTIEVTDGGRLELNGGKDWKDTSGGHYWAFTTSLVDNDISIGPGATLVSQRTGSYTGYSNEITGDVTNEGTCEVGYGLVFSGSLDNRNRLDVRGASLALLGTFDSGGAVVIDNGSITTSGEATSTGSLDITDGELSIGGTFLSEGPLTGSNAVLSGSGFLTNRSIMRASGSISVPLLNEASAIAEVTGPGTLTFSGGNQTNAGVCRALNGAAISFTDSFASTGSIEATESTLLIRNTATLDNRGTITVSGAGSVLRTDPDTPMGSSWIERTSRIIGSGTIEVTDGGRLELNGGKDWKDTSGGHYWAFTTSLVENDVSIGPAATLVSQRAGAYTGYSNEITGALNSLGVVDVAYPLRVRGGTGNVESSVLVEGSWRVRNGATLALDGVSIVGNEASISLEDASSSFPAISGLAYNSGSFTLLSGAQYAGSGDWDNSGVLTVGIGSTFDVNPGHQVTNTGEINGGGVLIGGILNSGLISPGSSSGELHIQGDLVQDDRGTLLIEIAGSDTGMYDCLAIAGSASLDGELHIVLEGYTPGDSETFTVMTYASRVGEFSNVTGTWFDGGRFDVVYGDTSLCLVSAVPEPGILVVTFLGALVAARRTARRRALSLPETESRDAAAR